MSKDLTLHKSALIQTALSLLFSLLLLAPICRAQDVVRPSLAGEAAAEARRQSVEQIPYNLLSVPLLFIFFIL